MLHRIFGPVGSGKRDFLLKEIGKAYGEGKRVFVIAPEQETAELELRICKSLGNGASMLVEVTNFSRLSNVVLREYGGLAGVFPTDAEKKLLLAECIRELRDRCPALSLREDADSVAELYGELEAMRMTGLWSESLGRLAAKELGVDGFSEKLEQLALLTASYSDLIHSRYRDPSEEGERLAATLGEYAFFQGSVVVIDGFWDFTYPQRKVIEAMMRQAEEVFVSFAARKREKLLFAKALKAAKALERSAREFGVEILDEVLEKDEGEDALGHLRIYFMKGTVPFAGKAEGLSLVACKSAVEEAEFVARECIRLTHQGVHWNEIAILSRDGSCEELLALIMEGKGIPHFVEEKKPLARTALARTLLYTCRFATGLGEESEVRSYLKDGYFIMADEKRFCLERYVSTWSLDGAKILRPTAFTMNPAGLFAMEEDSEEARELETVNLAKEQVFAPVRTLAAALRERKTVSEKLGAVLDFLSAIGAEKRILAEIAEAGAKENFEKAAALTGIWNCLLEALSALGRALGDRECSAERFRELLSLALSASLPGALPPGQDRVQVGRVDFARPAGAKYIFLMGLNADVFPAPEKKGGLFSKKERLALAGEEYTLPGGEESLSEEYFYFYLAAAFAEKALILSYRTESGKVDGASLSVLGKRLITLFPNVSHRLFDSATALPLTREDAFAYYVSRLDEESEGGEALKEYFLGREEYRLRAMDAAAARAEGVKRDLLQREKPYEGKDIGMVYSRLEKYTECPFSFFARYLLKAKTREKAKMAPNVAGNIVHKVMEKFMVALTADGLTLPDLSAKELEARCSAAVAESIREIPVEERGGSLRFLYQRLEESCLLILKNLQKEFEVSRFRPIFFEKKLSELNKAYRIPLKDGTDLCLYGDIDRVDLYTSEKGEDYVRVVDYKTGGHDFNLSELANGLSLQMLLYLFSLWNCGFRYGKGDEERDVSPLPASVIYLNGLAEVKACENMAEAKKTAEDPFFALSRTGLMVEEPELLAAQDPEGNKEFLPVEWKKKGGKFPLVTMEKLGRLKKRVEGDFARLAEALKEGEVSASPLCSKKSDPCEYCDYKPMCKRSEEDRMRRPYRVAKSIDGLLGEEE